MKLVKEVEEILKKYYLGVDIPEEYESVYKFEIDHPEKSQELFHSQTIDDPSLFEKYRKHIPKGWYGFSIGNPTPTNWFKAIDEIVSLCIEHDPDFEIHQIKLKFGGICFYVNTDVIEDMMAIEILIESKLYNKKLIY